MSFEKSVSKTNYYPKKKNTLWDLLH